MAYVNLPTRTNGVDSNSAADINQLQDNIDAILGTEATSGPAVALNGKMTQPSSKTNGNLVSMDANGNGVNAGMSKDDIVGRTLGSTGTGTSANWYKIAEYSFGVTAFSSFSTRLTVSNRKESVTDPRIYDVYLSCELGGDGVTIAQPILRMKMDYATIALPIFRATVDLAAKKVILWYKNSSDFTNSLYRVVDKIFTNSTTVAYFNTIKSPNPTTAPEGDDIGGFTNWEANMSNALVLDQAYTSYTPVVTAAIGTITTYTATGRYKKLGRIVTGIASITVTTNGTASSGIIMTLPVIPRTALNTDDSIGYGHITVSAQKSINAKLFSDSGTYKAVIRDYAGNHPVISGDKIHLSFNYESAT